MPTLNEQDFAQMVQDIKDLEKKYDIVLVPISEEDVVMSLRDAVVQEGDGEVYESTVCGMARDKWKTSQHFREDIRNAYSSDEPLRKVLFNTFRFGLRGWALDIDATELPRPKKSI